MLGTVIYCVIEQIDVPDLGTDDQVHCNIAETSRTADRWAIRNSRLPCHGVSVEHAPVQALEALLSICSALQFYPSHSVTLLPLIYSWPVPVPPFRFDAELRLKVATFTIALPEVSGG